MGDTAGGREYRRVGLWEGGTPHGREYRWEGVGRREYRWDGQQEGETTGAERLQVGWEVPELLFSFLCKSRTLYVEQFTDCNNANHPNMLRATAEVARTVPGFVAKYVIVVTFLQITPIPARNALLVSLSEANPGRNMENRVSPTFPQKNMSVFPCLLQHVYNFPFQTNTFQIAIVTDHTRTYFLPRLGTIGANQNSHYQCVGLFQAIFWGQRKKTENEPQGHPGGFGRGRGDTLLWATSTSNSRTPWLG